MFEAYTDYTGVAGFFVASVFTGVVGTAYYYVGVEATMFVAYFTIVWLIGVFITKTHEEQLQQKFRK